MNNQYSMSLYCKYNHPMYGKYLFVAKSGFRVCRAFPKDKYAVACMNCNFSMRFGRICPHELARRQVT